MKPGSNHKSRKEGSYLVEERGFEEDGGNRAHRSLRDWRR